MAKFEFEYAVFNNLSELDETDRRLVNSAIDTAKELAYAPYSKFRVGAAILLENNKIVKGANQENAATPVAICAERVALSTVSSIYPSEKITTIAIAYDKDEVDASMIDQVLSPCGVCRQTIVEYAARQNQKIQLLLTSASKRVIKIDDINQILPFSFGGDML